jgi:primary-amine oxidase
MKLLAQRLAGWCFLPLVLTILQMPAMGAPHPLAPLSAEEIRQAARVLRESGRFPAGAYFNQIALDEPSKEAVLAKTAVPRRAFAIIYDRKANQTFEAIANLATNAIDSWKLIPGVQPSIGPEDSDAADSIVRADPRWAPAIRAHGIRDVDNVVTMAWSAGYFGQPGTADGRIVCVVPYYAGAGGNLYAHPVEGIVAHVNLTTGKIVDFLDIDRNVPVSREDFDLNARPGGLPVAPLVVTQPNGPGFQIVDGEVRWQKWRFRYALHPREGLVVYTAGYEDGGKVRPVMYRGSLSEMVVPYGDPSGGWYFRNSFDAGELGLGGMASSLRPGVDCPANCSVFDAVMSTGSGEPNVIHNAVALYERDGGVEWKHDGNTRRARDLVLSYFSQPGNYEYGFDWVFHQDGTIEVRVYLTGIMSAKGVGQDADPHSHLVAKNLAAPHHQHFFTFRLDMDVDGTPNRVVEMNSVAMAAGKQNPFGGGFMMEETPLRTEHDAERSLNMASSRRWIVESASAKNGLGHPTGYALLPGENSVPFALPDSWVRKRAGFLNAHVWVTPYNAAERYAGGDYPNQSKGGDGLSKWAAANRPVDGKDVVLWYTMGITHNPRPEDWPVMPVYEAGFKLVPWGFFSSNPVMDLPGR